MKRYVGKGRGPRWRTHTAGTTHSPALAKLTIEAEEHALMKAATMVEYIYRDSKDGTFWLDITVDRSPYATVGPFDTEQSRDKVSADIQQMLRERGGTDLPLLPQ